LGDERAADRIFHPVYVDAFDPAHRSSLFDSKPAEQQATYQQQAGAHSDGLVHAESDRCAPRRTGRTG
jgi:hypothetical protein